LTGEEPTATFFVAGVWRDYVRQFGAVTIDRGDFIRLTGDARTTDLALWPAPVVDEGVLRDAITALAQQAPKAGDAGGRGSVGLGGAGAHADTRGVAATGAGSAHADAGPNASADESASASASASASGSASTNVRAPLEFS